MTLTDRIIDGWILGRSAISEGEPLPEAPPTFATDAIGWRLVGFALDAPARRFTLAFAAACALGSICAFLQEAWPIGLAELLGALVALYGLRAPD